MHLADIVLLNEAAGGFSEGPMRGKGRRRKEVMVGDLDVLRFCAGVGWSNIDALAIPVETSSEHAQFR